MGKLYDVTIYYETGFNMGNIPDGPAVLQLAESKSFRAVFLRQNKYLGSVDLQGVFDDFENADYCQVGNAYYFITSVEAVGGNTVRISLQIDAINTIGGVSNLKVISGWLSRAHPRTDTPFGNIMKEPWAPMHPLVVKWKKVYNAKDPTKPDVDSTVTVSTVDLWNMGQYASKLIQQAADTEAAEDADFMLIPQLPPTPDNPTEFQISDPAATGGVYHYNLPNMVCYLGDSTIQTKDGKNALEMVRSIGIESAIVAMYKIPAGRFDLQIRQGELTTLDWIRSKPQQLDGPNPIYGEPANAKASCLHNTISIASIAGGDSQTFDTADLYESSGSNVRFLLNSDFSPNGSDYIRPLVFQGQLTEFTEQSVKGVSWVNSGYSFQGGSGGRLTLATYARNSTLSQQIQSKALDKIDISMSQTKRNGIVDTVQGVVGGIADIGLSIAAPFVPTVSHSWGGGKGMKTTYSSGGNPLDVASGVIGGVNRIVDSIQGGVDAYDDYKKQQIERANAVTQFNMDMTSAMWDAAKSAQIVAPEITFPVEPGLVGYFGNAFLICQVGLDDRDVAMFDKFLTANGYATSEQYYDGCMTDRTKFNFVQFSDVQLDASAPMTMRMMAEDILRSGVRIWHKLATTADYDSNPRR
ncbi:MAG: hypothetical protein HDS66_05855 [Bacteroidales bacterium]|nr:hypothetical protein [Bacteroidales bacterium]